METNIPTYKVEFSCNAAILHGSLTQGKKNSLEGGRKIYMGHTEFTGWIF